MLPCLAICRGVYIALVYDMIDPCGNERIRREKYQEGRGDRRPATYSAQPEKSFSDVDINAWPRQTICDHLDK